MQTQLELTRERQQPASAPAKRPYAAPRLVLHGTAAQLTAGNGPPTGPGISQLDGPDQ